MNDLAIDKITHEIICEIQQGRNDAFAQLIELYEDMIIRQLRKLKVSLQDKEDLTQTIWYKIYLQSLTFEIKEDNSFTRCVRVIIKNAKVDHLRKINTEKHIFFHTMFTIDFQQVDDLKYENSSCLKNDIILQINKFEEETQQLVKNEGLSKLEENIVRYSLEGYSKKDISSLLDIPIKQIYNAQYRLKKKLNREVILKTLFDI